MTTASEISKKFAKFYKDNNEEITLKEMYEKLSEIFKQEKSSTKKKVQKETKTAREPSAYNIFMKDKIPELKIKYPTKEHSEIFKEAAKLWREKSS